jgi:uncharacterized protein involved in exopolysaccharide biosynthesis
LADEKDSLYSDGEINLGAILLSLWKRRKTFAGIVLITVAVGVVFALCMPERYRISLVIRPGVMDVSSDGKNVYIDSTNSIKAKIDSSFTVTRRL